MAPRLASLPALVAAGRDLLPSGALGKWIAAGGIAVIQGGTSLVCLKLAATLLPKADLALYLLTLSVVQLHLMVGCVPLISGAARYFSPRMGYSTFAWSTRQQFWVLVTSALTLTVFLGVQLGWEYAWWLGPSALVGLLGLTSFQASYAYLRALRRPQRLFRFALVEGGTRIGLTVLATQAGPWAPAALVAALGVGAWCWAAPLSWRWWRQRARAGGRAAGQAPHPEAGAIWKFAWPLGLLSVLGWVQTLLDRWLLEGYGLRLAVAEVGVAVQIASFCFASVNSMLALTSIPRFYRQQTTSGALAPGTEQQLWRLAGWYLALAVPLWLMLVLTAPVVLQLLASTAFAEASPLLIVAALGWLIFYFSQFLAEGVLVASRTGLLLWPNLSACVALVGSFWWMVPSWGAMAAPYAFLVSVLVRLLLLLLCYRFVIAAPSRHA